MRQPNDHVDRFYEARDAFYFALLPTSLISALGGYTTYTGIFRARGSILGCLEGGGGGGGGEVSCPNQPTNQPLRLTASLSHSPRHASLLSDLDCIIGKGK